MRNISRAECDCYCDKRGNDSRQGRGSPDNFRSISHARILHVSERHPLTHTHVHTRRSAFRTLAPIRLHTPEKKKKKQEKEVESAFAKKNRRLSNTSVRAPAGTLLISFLSTARVSPRLHIRARIVNEKFVSAAVYINRERKRKFAEAQSQGS